MSGAGVCPARGKARKGGIFGAGQKIWGGAGRAAQRDSREFTFYKW